MYMNSHGHHSKTPGQASHCDGRTIQRARRSKSARWIAVDAQHLASEINERAKDAAWDGLAWGRAMAPEGKFPRQRVGCMIEL